MSRKTNKLIIIILVAAILPFTVLAGVYVYRETLQQTSVPKPTPGVVERTPESTPNIIEVESIRILVEFNEIAVGTRFLPEVIVYPLNATDKTFELRSDNELVIRQLGNNWVAADVGTANLIATASNGVIETFEITVIVPVGD